MDTSITDQFSAGFSGLVVAIVTIADLPHYVQQNIEYNATQEEITQINGTMRATAITVRRVKSFAADGAFVCKDPLMRTEKRLHNLSSQAEELRVECFDRAASLAECAQICQTAGKTTILSFIYRCRWGMMCLGGSLVLHFSPLMLTAVPTALVVTGITAAAASISVPACYHLGLTLNQVKSEWREFKGSETELNGIAKEIEEISKYLQTMSEKSAECVEMEQFKSAAQWLVLEKSMANMAELCDKALAGILRVPVLRKATFCVIS